jgi:peptidoglycan/xylan/chitin deacetylase (PgdA/CDA1 family)
LVTGAVQRDDWLFYGRRNIEKSTNPLINTGFKSVADSDSQDWKDYGVDSIINKTVGCKDLGNGSIILMHNGAKYTPAALEAIIVGLKDKGYQIVPISQLIYTGEYTIDHTGRQFAK